MDIDSIIAAASRAQQAEEAGLGNCSRIWHVGFFLMVSIAILFRMRRRNASVMSHGYLGHFQVFNKTLLMKTTLNFTFQDWVPRFRKVSPRNFTT